MTDIYAGRIPTEQLLREITLQRYTTELKQYVSKQELARCAHPEFMLVDCAETLAMRLVVDMFGREASSIVRYPDGWWQAFRERFFPRWWLRKHPVRYQNVVVKARELFPTITGIIGDYATVYISETKELKP